MSALWQVAIALREFMVPHAIKWDTVEPIPSGSPFAGQSVIVTGATSGLGLEAAINYVQHGAATVYITARNETRGAEAKETIETRTGKKDIVKARVLDMDTFEGVKGFVNGLKKEVESIDIALLNAGAHSFEYLVSPEGWEIDLQVNVLSTSLLGLLILQWMRDIKKPTQRQIISFTGSGSHMSPNIESPDFPKQDILKYWTQKQNYKSGRWNYGISKLLLTYSVREIASIAIDENGRQVIHPSPIVNIVCPGLIKTPLVRGITDKGLFYKLVADFIMWWQGALPAEAGSQSLVVTTLSNEHGKFRRPYMTDADYEEKVKVTLGSIAGNKMQSQVWKEIIEVLNVQDPEVSKIARL